MSTLIARVTVRTLTKGVKNFHDRMYELAHNGMEISVVEEEGSVLPWDAGVDFDGNKAYLSGGVSSNGFGSVEIQLPQSHFNNFYHIEFWPRDGKEGELIELLESVGFDVEEKEE